MPAKKETPAASSQGFIRVGNQVMQIGQIVRVRVEPVDSATGRPSVTVFLVAGDFIVFQGDDADVFLTGFGALSGFDLRS